jgi:ketosteroid isomerase-like protein
MATKAIHSYYDDSDAQRMLQKIVQDVVQVFGHDCWYVPRTVDVREEVLNEAETASYRAAYPVEMYVKTVDHMGGEGALLQKYGLTEYDELTFTISMKAWAELVRTRDTTLTRPREGDLIYVPMIRAAFRVRYVDKKAFFYQLGELQAWDVVAELYEASSETFDTGVPEIDDVYQLVTEDLSELAVTTEDGDLLRTEDGWYLEVVDYRDYVPDMDDGHALEDAADDIIDWSESNPFGDEGINT